MIRLPVRRYLSEAAATIERTPVEALLAVLVAASFSWALEIGMDEAFLAWWEVTVIALLIGSVAWIGTLLHGLGAWTVRRRQVVTLVATILAALYGAFLLRLDLEAEGWRAGALIGAVLLFVTAAPTLARVSREPQVPFRTVNARVGVRLLAAAFYAMALFTGLALAIAAVETLFDLEMSGDIYGHVFGWIAFVLGPWIALAGLPYFVRPMDEQSELMGVLLRIAGWLIPPLLLIYNGILYAYAVRIGVTGELPKNLVSPLVLASGVLTVLTVILFYPAPGKGLGARVLRLTPVLFIPLAALGLYAVSVRVGQYGWTEFRYLRVGALVALVLLAVGASVELFKGRRFSIHLVPMVGGVLLLLSAFGPWGASAVARRSQHSRLVEALAEAGLLQGDSLVLADTGERTVPNDVYEQVGATASFLVLNFGADAAAPLPADLLERDSLGAMPGRLGLRREEPAKDDRPRSGSLAAGVQVGLGEENVLRVRLSGSPERGRPAATATDSSTVRLWVEDRRLTADLGPLVTWLVETDVDQGAAVLPEDLAVVPLVGDDGERWGTLVVFELRLERPEEALVIARLEGVAVLIPPSQSPGVP